MRRKSAAFLASYALALSLLCAVSNIYEISSTNAAGAVTKSKRVHVPRDEELAETKPSSIIRTVQVQIVHRHGDRTPITPMKDEKYWASTLIPEDVSEKIGLNTKILRNEEAAQHSAGGRGPFGQLTQIGLFQMVDLGRKLREELNSERESSRHVWDPQRPLHPRNIKIVSTDFSRTVQSIQGVLVGLFPDGTDETIPIDARHTNSMIPDPQPRGSAEQIELEMELASRPHLVLREQEMHQLALTTTRALKDVLSEHAFEVNFGVGEETNKSKDEMEKVLPWAQLAEVTKCLRLRNLLPDAIAQKDQEIINEYAAWRWFENLRHPRLAFLAMNKMATKIIQIMLDHSNQPPVTIYSAHDSTLIGLICAFRLEQPSVWPEYGSYLKVELIEVQNEETSQKEYKVKFSLNGNTLRSVWDDVAQEEIPLSFLDHKVKTEGSHSSN